MAGTALRKIPNYGDTITAWQERHNDLLYHENHIRKKLASIQESFIHIGYHLCDIEAKRLYETVYYQSSGNYCKNVFEYAFQELDIARTTVYNLMAVAREFSQNATGLLPQYKDYSFSQLVELLSFTQPQREYADPHLTIKQLRALKKNETVTWYDEEQHSSHTIKIPAEFLNSTEDHSELNAAEEPHPKIEIEELNSKICPDVGTNDIRIEANTEATEEPIQKQKEITETVHLHLVSKTEFMRWLRENYNSPIYPIKITYQRRKDGD